jgi:hypothetical protein
MDRYSVPGIIKGMAPLAVASHNYRLLISSSRGAYFIVQVSRGGFVGMEARSVSTTNEQHTPAAAQVTVVRCNVYSDCNCCHGRGDGDASNPFGDHGEISNPFHLFLPYADRIVVLSSPPQQNIQQRASCSSSRVSSARKPSASSPGHIVTNKLRFLAGAENIGIQRLAGDFAATSAGLSSFKHYIWRRV